MGRQGPPSHDGRRQPALHHRRRRGASAPRLLERRGDLPSPLRRGAAADALALLADGEPVAHRAALRAQRMGRALADPRRDLGRQAHDLPPVRRRHGPRRRSPAHRAPPSPWGHEHPRLRVGGEVERGGLRTVQGRGPARDRLLRRHDGGELRRRQDHRPRAGRGPRVQLVGRVRRGGRRGPAHGGAPRPTRRDRFTRRGEGRPALRRRGGELVPEHHRPARRRVDGALQPREGRRPEHLQLYRHDRLAFLRASDERARSKGYLLGAKLVRGAYMVKESERAMAKGEPSPFSRTSNRPTATSTPRCATASSGTSGSARRSAATTRRARGSAAS